MTHKQRIALVVGNLGEALADPEFSADPLERAEYLAERLEGEALALRLAIRAVKQELARRSAQAEAAS